MSKANAAKNLYQNLACECDMAMALVDILLEEQACLIKLQTIELNSLALRKEATMLELEKRYLANIQLAKAEGFAPNLDGIALWVDQLAIYEPKLLVTYSNLRSSLTQAQRLNKINGELVSEQLAGLQERIAILTAAAVAGQQPTASDTYSSKGDINQLSSSSCGIPRAVIR
jgi:flagellar biosynthesis/type III secretory pathway chaperone